MIVQVKLFAAARQLLDQDTVQLELPDGATVGVLRQALKQQFPPLGLLADRSLVAVGLQYAGDDVRLCHDQEIALIPPVSGG
ncbi:MAG: hypothetical protein KatS3mg109_1443 [Pirellulaceae bacterium]|nr:MAG: hypothetical protein KatS3mg109_1443 [Pirellulaceae bacterium]